MSETDSFIQEVTEEVRQDQMLRYWKKYGPFVIGGVVLIVAAAAGWNWMMAQEQAEAEARGAAFLAVAPEDVEQASSLPTRIDGPANIIAELSAAAALASSGDTVEAAARYGQIAERPGLLPAYRDLAVLQQVRLAAMTDTSTPTAPLDGLIDGNSPYRLLALELRGALRIVAGDRTAGHADLNAVIHDPQATGTLRQRAGALLTATGGEQEQTSG